MSAVAKSWYPVVPAGAEFSTQSGDRHRPAGAERRSVMERVAQFHSVPAGVFDIMIQATQQYYATRSTGALVLSCPVL